MRRAMNKAQRPVLQLLAGGLMTNVSAGAFWVSAKDWAFARSTGGTGQKFDELIWTPEASVKNSAPSCGRAWRRLARKSCVAARGIDGVAVQIPKAEAGTGEGDCNEYRARSNDAPRTASHHDRSHP